MSDEDNYPPEEEMVDARDLDQEQIEELMPEQSPPLPLKVLYHVAGLVTFLAVFSPAIAYFAFGFEASIACFLTGALVVLVQS